MGIRRFFKVIAIFLCAAVCGGALLFAACAPEDDPPAYTQMRALFAESGKVYDDAGYEVTLRGVNAGGLFVTEHWMTGFSYGTQPDNDYRSLTQTFLERFGEQKTKDLWAPRPTRMTKSPVPLHPLDPTCRVMAVSRQSLPIIQR